MQNLVIVESPAKAKTIEKYLGSEFKVLSSYGHIRDLRENDLSVDVKNNFTPKYEVSLDKLKLIKELKHQVSLSDMVWLASDEDREGEAIAWHLYETLGLKQENSKRIVFNEITKNAILNAIKNPRNIDKNLVDAQQARRVLDRLVGYELSPILWKKVKPANSAGRVQSVAVKLIVEREREINKFNSESVYKVFAVFFIKDKKIKCELSRKIKDFNEVKKLLESFKQSTFSIKNIIKKDSFRNPSAPFTTSSLQQEAGHKFSMSVSQTMRIAQFLYEAGYITYMRTDSTNLSDFAIDQMKTIIPEKYGDKYLKIRAYHTKSKGAQEAHEAIRPTNFNNPTIDGDNQQKRLYELIFKRAIASQMSEAIIENTNFFIEADNNKEIFIAKGEIIKFDGFMKVYVEDKDDSFNDEENSLILPEINQGEKLTFETIFAKENYSNPLPRFSEASLVNKLEELGIGRPSTYAPTINTIQKRNYVIKETRPAKKRNINFITLFSNLDIVEEIKDENYGVEKNKLFPTDIGVVVTDFLEKNFKDIVNYYFTANVEDKFDKVANGEIAWQSMISDFYFSFHENVVKTNDIKGEKIGERVVGVDTKTGKNVIAKVGKFGPIVQIGEFGDKDKPRFAKLLKKQSIETITLEEAMTLFELPKVLGEYENKDVTTNIGKFGPYVQWNGKFVSIKGGQELVFSITLEEAIELINSKAEFSKSQIIKEFKENKDVIIVKGKFGPYIKCKTQNVKIPKDKSPEELTLSECLELASKTKPKATSGNNSKKNVKYKIKKTLKK